MKSPTFGTFVEEIKSLQEWRDVFPRDIDEKRSRRYAEQLGSYFPPDIKWEEYCWPGAKDVLGVLEHQALSGPGLESAVHAFRHKVQKIHEGLLRYGKYDKADRGADRPQKDYAEAVQLFIQQLERASPKLHLAPFKRTLLFTKGSGLRMTNERHRESILKFCRRFLAGLRVARREGRPVQPDSVFIYHLVNNLTIWRRKKNGDIMMNKRRRPRLERRWDDVARVLIWTHYRRMPLPWVGTFVKRWSRSPEGASLIRFKKIIQRKYAHLGPPPDQEISPEAAFFPLDRTIFTFVEDDGGRSGFRTYPI